MKTTIIISVLALCGTLFSPLFWRGGGGEVFAQSVGINPTGAAPNASAMLDVDATNKGLLIPRVPLTITTSNAPIGAGIATSLLVYNTATINNVTPGYYYWDGTVWVSLGGSGGTPQGGIIMWSGTLATIPAGWALCDGTLGTPNLLDRFILSVNTAQNPGATGGTHSYSLTNSELPAHTHTGSGTTSSDGAHSHNYTTLGQWADVDRGGGSSLWSIDNIATFSTTTAGVHNHTYSFTTSSTGSGTPIDNRPAYYTLAFIMKL